MLQFVMFCYNFLFNIWKKWILCSLLFHQNLKLSKFLLRLLTCAMLAWLLMSLRQWVQVYVAFWRKIKINQLVFHFYLWWNFVLFWRETCKSAFLIGKIKLKTKKTNETSCFFKFQFWIFNFVFPSNLFSFVKNLTRHCTIRYDWKYRM